MMGGGGGGGGRGVGGGRDAGGGTRPAAPRTHGVRSPAGGLPDSGASRRGARPGRSGGPWKAAFFALMAAAIVAGGLRARPAASPLALPALAATRIPLPATRRGPRGAGGLPG